MSENNVIKKVRIRDQQGNLSQPIPIGSDAVNVDYYKLNDSSLQSVQDFLNDMEMSIYDSSWKGSGENSILLNDSGNRADGRYSCAQGESTEANGESSHAQGSHTEADGRYSHAQGESTEANGDSSHAQGESTRANGEGSHAQGYYTEADGRYSHAQGDSTQARGNLSHTEGELTIATHKAQHVFGKNNIPEENVDVNDYGTYVEIVGNGSSSNRRSNARTLDWAGNEWVSGRIRIGGTEYNDANAKLVLTEQDVDFSNAVKAGGGIDSLVLNKVTSNTATGEGSLSAGHINSATGEYSTTFGNNNIASGISSFAHGSSTTAQGNFSHTEGLDTLAMGESSHAEGSYTTATHANQHVFGTANNLDPSPLNNQYRGTYIEIVGNGSSSNNRSNARTLDWSGNEWVSGNLKIGGIGYTDTNAKEVATKEYVNEQVLQAESVVIDSELEKSGFAADAYVVGQNLIEINKKIEGILPKKEITDVSSGSAKKQLLCISQDGTTLSWVNYTGQVCTNWNDAELYNVMAASLTKTAIEEKLNKPSGTPANGQLLAASDNKGHTKWIDSNTYVKSPNTNQRGNGKVLTIKQQGTSWITQWSDPVNVDKTLKISNMAADARTIGQKLGVEGASSKNKKDFSQKSILFIGDSYGHGQVASVVPEENLLKPESNLGWIRYCAQYLGMQDVNNISGSPLTSNASSWIKNDNQKFYFNTNKIDTDKPYKWDDDGYWNKGGLNQGDYPLKDYLNGNNRCDLQNSDLKGKYRSVYSGGTRFATGNLTGYNFAQLIQHAHEFKYPYYNFDVIVLCAGYNDASWAAGVEDTALVIQTVQNGIQQFYNYVQAKYGNYTEIYLGCIGGSKKGFGHLNNKSIGKENWQDIQMWFEECIVPIYKDFCNKHENIYYLNNIEHYLDNKSLLANTDGFHPTKQGNQLLGWGIAQALLYGQAPSPYIINDSVPNDLKSYI